MNSLAFSYIVASLSFPYQGISQEPTDLASALKQIQQLKRIIGKKELEIEVLSDLLKKTNAH